MSFPYDINYVEPKLNEQLLNDFHGERSGFVQVGKTRWFFPSRFKQYATSLHSFEARVDDTWVVTYPRSGTTWTQEMVWLISNNLDFVSANKIPLTQRFPFFEFHLFMHDEVKAELLDENQQDKEKCKFIEKLSQPVHVELDEMKQPRFIKTHLPTSLLPPSIFKNKAKIIYVARNPSDVVVSYYHLNRLYRTQGYEGDFPKFYDYFEKDLSELSPSDRRLIEWYRVKSLTVRKDGTYCYVPTLTNSYITAPWSPYWDHVKEGWAMKSEDNVLFMFYEDMKRNLPETIRRTAAFLNKTVSDEQVTLLCNHLDIKNFRHNKSVTCEELKQLGILKEGEQGFVRKGQVNGNTEELTETIRHRIKEWSERNLIGSDLRFPDC